MNPARFKSIETNLTGVARKVYEATPISEAWPPQRIGSEVFRQTGSQVDPKTLVGCLASLVESGLVRERGHKCFQRESIHEKPPHVKLVKDEPIQAIKKPEQCAVKSQSEVDVLNVFGSAAKTLRDAAEKIEEAGLAVAKELADKDKENGLVKQLKALLKD